MPWLPVVHTPVEVEAYFISDVLPQSVVWVAEISGDLAGFAALQGSELEHFYIAPPFWRQGVGRLLLARCRQETDRLELWTFQRNEGARRFYESQGFTVARVTDGSSNEEREPDVRYVWQRGIGESDA